MISLLPLATLVKGHKMQGDNIVVEAHHLSAAEVITSSLLKTIDSAANRFTISVAGESGSGKSETATAIACALENYGISSIIFQQDDYFIYPPKSNDAARRNDEKWVGPQEVKIDLLSSHLEAFQEGKSNIRKPLIDYSSDTIAEEIYDFNNAQVAIAEGTYTSLLKSVDIRIFIARDFNQTLEHRQKRNRDISELDSFTENILRTEHAIISEHRALADIVINSDYTVDLKPK